MSVRKVINVGMRSRKWLRPYWGVNEKIHSHNWLALFALGLYAVLYDYTPMTGDYYERRPMNYSSLHLQDTTCSVCHPLLCYRQLDDCAYVVFRFVFLTLLCLGAFVLMYCRRQGTVQRCKAGYRVIRSNYPVARGRRWTWMQTHYLDEFYTLAWCTDAMTHYANSLIPLTTTTEFIKQTCSYRSWMYEYSQ